MKIIRLKLKKDAYDIAIGLNILGQLGHRIKGMNIGSSAYVITNALIKNRYGSALEAALSESGLDVRFKLVPDTEKSKSLEMVSAILKDISSYDKNRHIFIIAFGGGVIGDLAGFIASIYKRGISYVQVPTTLLAQVDSSIGGKTAVDLAEGKNLVGAFYQPALVFSEISTLETLSLRQLRAGLAEVIKYGAIKDHKLFSYLEKNQADILKMKNVALEHIVIRCAEIKASVVQKDEREKKGIRTILNFGHTIGHALEAASGYKSYNHGEAIALGMLVACDISRRLGLLDNEVSKKIEDLIRIVGLPVKIEKASLQDIIKAHYHDKKFVGSKNRFVLLKGIGRTAIVEDVPLGVIKEAIKSRSRKTNPKKDRPS